MEYEYDSYELYEPTETDEPANEESLDIDEDATESEYFGEPIEQFDDTKDIAIKKEPK